MIWKKNKLSHSKKVSREYLSLIMKSYIDYYFGFSYTVEQSHTTIQNKLDDAKLLIQHLAKLGEIICNKLNVETQCDDLPEQCQFVNSATNRIKNKYQILFPNLGNDDIGSTNPSTVAQAILETRIPYASVEASFYFCNQLLQGKINSVSETNETGSTPASLIINHRDTSVMINKKVATLLPEDAEVSLEDGIIMFTPQLTNLVDMDAVADISFDEKIERLLCFCEKEDGYYITMQIMRKNKMLLIFDPLDSACAKDRAHKELLARVFYNASLYMVFDRCHKLEITPRDPEAEEAALIKMAAVTSFPQLDANKKRFSGLLAFWNALHVALDIPVISYCHRDQHISKTEVKYLKLALIAITFTNKLMQG